MNFGAELPERIYGYALQGWDLARGWLVSPAAWSQFALLVAAFVLAWLLSRWLTPRLRRLLTARSDSRTILSRITGFVAVFLPLAMPLLAYALTGMGEQVTRSLFGSGEVVAFGKRVFLFLAARRLVNDIVTDPFLRLIGRYVLLPIAALYVVGLLDDVSRYLDETIVQLGNIAFSALTLVQGLIAGSLLFWLGRWSNDQSASYIKRQKLRPAARELAVKAAEIAIFGLAFLLLLSILGIDLTALAVIGGALGVGLGFGLQKIASNFISGIILLLEGQTSVGDFVELDGGEAGTIVKMTARAAVLETFDGRWILVPNEDFITTRVVNYSDSGSANRYEAPFSVSYGTDINQVPAIIEAAVATHPEVLDKPYPPDCELRRFGDSSIDFAVEFWVNGIDDGPNKYVSDVLFLIWNALRDNGIEIPYPQRVVHIENDASAV